MDQLICARSHVVESRSCATIRSRLLIMYDMHCYDLLHDALVPTYNIRLTNLYDVSVCNSRSKS